MKKILPIILVGCLGLTAQNPVKTSMSIPRGAVSNFNEVEEGPWYITIENTEAGQHLNDNEKIQMRALKGEVVQQYPTKSSMTENVDRSVPSPIINNSFNANSASGSVPMDNYMAISDSGLITSVSNTIIQVYNESGTIIKSRSLILTK